MLGPRLESILGHCERHALLHMAPKWLDHWTTWAGQYRRVRRRQTRGETVVLAAVAAGTGLLDASAVLLASVSPSAADRLRVQLARRPRQAPPLGRAAVRCDWLSASTPSPA